MQEPEIVAEGLVFPEGPVVMSDESVIVVETFAGRITRCWKGRKETICEIGDGPNGAPRRAPPKRRACLHRWIHVP